MTDKISIASLTRGDPRLEFVGSLFGIREHSAIGHIEIKQTLYLHHGREEMALSFMQNETWGDWLMFIDDDTLFTREAFDTLIAEANPATRPIIGGVYWSPNHATLDPTNDVFPVVFNLDSGERGTQYQDCFVHRPMPRGWVAAQTEPFECDAIGTGFLMIHRSVLAHMMSHYPGPLHWFTMDTIDGVAAGEDLNFCYRAKELGYPVWAVPLGPDQIQHMKIVRIVRPNPENCHA